MADMAAVEEIYEWNIEKNAILEEKLYTIEMLKMSNLQIESHGEGGLQKSFCAFSKSTKR